MFFTVRQEVIKPLLSQDGTVERTVDNGAAKTLNSIRTQNSGFAP
jgi:hypothetical protein